MSLEIIVFGLAVVLGGRVLMAVGRGEFDGV